MSNYKTYTYTNMRSKITMWMMALLAMTMTACSNEESGPTVAPPSWKGFNYVVKKAVGDEYEQIERGAIKPGDEIKVYAVRKSKGKLVGQINGTIYVRYTAYTQNGKPHTGVLDKSATSIPNETRDEWDDPYATFTMPEIEGECNYYRVDVACQLYFRTSGNQYSEVDFSDNTSHVDPYIGHIYTDQAGFHPMNGGSAYSGREAGDLQYHTIYLKDE